MLLLFKNSEGLIVFSWRFQKVWYVKSERFVNRGGVTAKSCTTTETFKAYSLSTVIEQEHNNPLNLRENLTLKLFKDFFVIRQSP